MSYQFYKLLHFYAILVFVYSAAFLLLKDSTVIRHKIISGVASFFILFAGMGLVARLGSGFPLWVWSKLILLLVVTAFVHVAAKRFPQWGVRSLGVILLLIAMAMSLAVLKPVL